MIVLKWSHCFTTVISNIICCQKNISINEVILSGARICCLPVIRWWLVWNLRCWKQCYWSFKVCSAWPWRWRHYYHWRLFSQHDITSKNTYLLWLLVSYWLFSACFCFIFSNFTRCLWYSCYYTYWRILRKYFAQILIFREFWVWSHLLPVVLTTTKKMCLCVHKHTHRKGPNFGRVFLRSNYNDITQNTYIQSSMVTEILTREVWNFDSYYSRIDYQIHIETGRNMWFL